MKRDWSSAVNLAGRLCNKEGYNKNRKIHGIDAGAAAQDVRSPVCIVQRLYSKVARKVQVC